MKEVLKKGKKKVYQFKCAYCGEHWKTDEWGLGDTEFVLLESTSSQCETCGNWETKIDINNKEK
jgi:hypothetical protein